MADAKALAAIFADAWLIGCSRYGIASACIGGGQGIALQIENCRRDLCDES
jgi:hypothetical protein